ncbi:MAG: single-stranded DNA-binding protein [Planctomycetes bacterium]|nr:single-stranded DNA-binding protein [Planctomycetota bacterium]MBI3833245.1 single-stranded DNA-binding protein [Planctomycetota bacterium]
MASYNRIVLLGNLTRDPQLSYTGGNLAVCKFGLATNHRWKDKEGKDREDVCFVDCTVFGRAGETFNQYMKKGGSVLVEGRLQLNQWTTPEGDKRSKHEVLVDNFTFVGGRPGGGSGGSSEAAMSGAPAGASRGGAPTSSAPDDIPF